MPSESGRRVDTFVVRVWRDGPDDRWLRLDVEHVRANGRAVHTWPHDPAAEWNDASAESAGRWLVRRMQTAAVHDAPEENRSCGLD